jgi:hypothetical protein
MPTERRQNEVWPGLVSRDEVAAIHKQLGCEVLCAAVDWMIANHVLDARSIASDVRLSYEEEVPIMDRDQALTRLQHAGWLK